MKKYSILLLSIAAVLFLAGCQEDIEPGGTAVEQLAGDWYVKGDAIDESGNVVFEDADLFGVGRFHLITYNTTSNSPSELYINDEGTFWDFIVKINADINALTFQGNDVQNESYDCKVNISNGKILLGATKTPSGSPADSIVFTVSFSDDEYPAKYGYAAYRISGYRYTGFSDDE